MSAISCLESKQLTNLAQHKLTVLQPVKKFPTFYETQRFITMITTAHHLSQSLATDSSPYPPIILQIHLILFSQFCLSSKWSPSFCLRQYNPVRISLLTHTCPTSLCTLDVIKLTVFGKDSLCTFLPSPYTSFLQGHHHPILQHPPPMLFL
jgi:hypothetical protein